MRSMAPARAITRMSSVSATATWRNTPGTQLRDLSAIVPSSSPAPIAATASGIGLAKWIIV